LTKLRIAYLCEGAFTHIDPYIEYAKEQGHEVCLIVYARLGRDHAVPTFDVSRGARGDRKSSKWKYLLAGFSVRRILKDFKPDVVHGHQVTSAGTICLLSGFKPYILTAHGSDVLKNSSSPIWRPVLKAAFARSAAVNTVSEELAEIVERMGVSRDKIIVAGPGIELSRFPYRPRVPYRSPTRLLCTRTLADVYDPLVLVRGCDALRNRGRSFSLTFAAGGPMLPQIEQLVRQMDLGEYVRLLGGYDQDQLPELLSQHDLYVSASRWDGTSLSMLEAMASGLTPIVSKISSNELLLQDGVTARMFECGDSESFADQVEWAIDHPEWAAPASEMNRRTVEESGDRAMNMASLEKVYHEAADTSFRGKL
jgi:glycosyltransferase involved in cell wall biosynthesis